MGLLQKVAKRKSDPRLYADELGKGLVGELDYNLEATNASEFLVSHIYFIHLIHFFWPIYSTDVPLILDCCIVQEAHLRFPFIYVPKVFRHLSSRRILTMEWVDGENPKDLLLLSQGSGYHSVGPVGFSERQQLEAKRHLLDLVTFNDYMLLVLVLFLLFFLI